MVLGAGLSNITWNFVSVVVFPQQEVSTHISAARQKVFVIFIVILFFANIERNRSTSKDRYKKFHKENLPPKLKSKKEFHLLKKDRRLF